MNADDRAAFTIFRLRSTIAALAPRGAPECGDLALVEIPELAGADVLVANRADPHTTQTDDRVADRFAHSAHLPVAPLVKHDRQHRVIAALRFNHFLYGDFRLRGLAPIERDAVRQPVECMLVRNAAYSRLVLACDTVAGVHQALGQLAVARQDQ